MILHLDFETYSEIDLRKVGAYAYAMHPSTKVLCMAWRFDSGPIRVWSPFLGKLGIKPTSTIVEGVPGLVFDHIDAELPVAGWNVGFEFLIWNHVLPRTLNGLPRMNWSQLRDVMAQGAYHGLPLSLDQAAAALPLGILKDKVGHQLMLRMSRPRVRARGNTPATWWHETSPDRLLLLMDYCVQDVKTESAIERFLPELPDRERDIWQMDFRANARGIKLDNNLARQMVRVAEAEDERLNGNISQATSGMVPTTTRAVHLVNWLNARWQSPVPLTSVAKEHLPDLVRDARGRQDHMAVAALEAREEAAKSSVAKVHTMLRWAQADGRMHGLVAYYGAFRTGRWAGRGPQVQNFPRPDPGLGKDDIPHVIKYLLALEKYSPSDLPDHLDGFGMFWGLSPLDAIKTSLRGCLIPTLGRLFASVDFGQIESRVLAWLAGESWVLDAYIRGEDLYVIQAGKIFQIPEESVTPFQRQCGKVGILAGGFGGGVGAYEKMAANYNLDLSKLNVKGVVDAYRGSVPRIREYWQAVERAAKLAITKPGQVVQVTTAHSTLYPGSIPEVQFATYRGHLLCKLPSGRTLWYRDAKIIPGKFVNGAVEYAGVDQYTRQWTRIETWGGGLAENLTQAVARCLLADAMLAVDKLKGIYLLGSVHDEIIAEVDGHAAYARMLAAMKVVPPWAGGLPLDASGYCGERFGK